MTAPLRDNLHGLLQDLHRLTAAAGRPGDSVCLVAVSKSRTVDEIRQALATGLRHFGENYAQEFSEKYSALKDEAISWHFIGHLQSNKVKLVCHPDVLIHTVDRLSLAQQISRTALQNGFVQRCLIQVKLTKETAKSGCDPKTLPQLLQEIIKLPALDVCGLMAIGSLTDNPEATRQEFQHLHLLRDELNATLKLASPLTELSMGMSHDFEPAILAGATIIRIGTRIFGERKKSL